MRRRSSSTRTWVAVLAIFLLGSVALLLHRGQQLRWMQLALDDPALLIARLNSNTTMLTITWLSLMIASSLMLIFYSRLKRTNQALISSSDRLRHLLDRIPVLLAVVDEQGRPLVWNRACQRVTGLTLDEIAAHPDKVGELFPPDAVRGNGSPWTGEGETQSEIVDADGARHSVVWVRVADDTLVPGRHAAIVGSDISDAVQAQRALTRSEAQYRQLFGQMQEAFALHEVIWDAAGQPTDYRFLAVNPAFERETGLAAQDLVGQTVRQVLPTLEPFWLETYGRVALSAMPSVFEAYTGALGRHFRVSAYCPRPGQFATLFHDVSETVRLTDELRQARDRYQLLVESQADVLMQLDSKGRLTFVSPSLCTFVGCSELELLGTAAADLTHEEDRQRAAATIAEMLRSPQPLVRSNRVKTPAGYRWVSWSGRTLVDADGQATGLVAVGRDMTAQRQAEEALSESQRQLSTLMANLPGMAYRCRADAQWTMEFVSEGCLDLTGFQPHDLVQNRVVSYGSLIHPDDREAVWRAVQEGIANRTPFQLSYRLVTPSGGSRWVWEKGRGVWDAQGHMVGLEGFVTDISERIALEEQLRQSQKMEVVGRLAGGIAHDFNNLLTVINGYTQLAVDALSEGDDLLADLREVRRAGQRAADLTQRLLAFSRREQVALRPIDLNEVLLSVVSMVRRVVGEHIQVGVQLAAELQPVLADSGQLERVIVNLATNARDAMPSGGELTFATQAITEPQGRSLRGGELAPGEYVELSVGDSGQGMPPDVQEHLFEPFYTTKEVGKGTGLGLAMIYGIVQELGGVIDVRSQEGLGTTFALYFPVAEPDRQPDSSQASPAIPQGWETLLLVEDQAQVRQLAHRMLAQLGYQVVAAADGPSALDLCQSLDDPPHLVLADVVMPGMSGPELVGRLLQRYPALHVLYISGYPDGVMPQLNEVANGAILVRKPFTLVDLAQRVRRALDGNGQG